MNFLQQISPLKIFLLQLILIIGISHLLGKLLNKLGQPMVIGEICAGIVLGPSMFGALFPETFDNVFKNESISILNIISQLGLILFMFTVGLCSEDPKSNNSANRYLTISIVSMLFPFFLGVLIAPLLYESFAYIGVSQLIFTSFIGIACSITAFPVLARIINDKDLAKDQSSKIALKSAAIGDLLAWIALATIIGLTKNSALDSLISSISMSLLGIIILFRLISPLLNYTVKNQILSEPENFILGILTVLFSALYFEWIGIHALFGAFIAGIAMPKLEGYRNSLKFRIEYVAGLILLPVFFTITGLRTEINIINSLELALVCLAVIFICIIGKFVGAGCAAKFCGFNWRDSCYIGILMNTRGLMELVILNIGLELRIINQSLFTIMVIMALVTTFMAGPLIDLIKKTK